METTSLAELIKLLIMLSAGVAAILQASKTHILHPLKARYPQVNQHYNAIVTGAGILLGIAMALGAGEQVDFLAVAGFTKFHAIVGIVLSGALVGLGENAIHGAYDLVGNFSEFANMFFTGRTVEDVVITTTVDGNGITVEKVERMMDEAAEKMREGIASRDLAGPA